MTNQFFERPVINSPYDYPSMHWELDGAGQPTGRILEQRRRAEFITPIPKPKKRKNAPVQEELIFDEAKEVSTGGQRYETMSMVNEIRQRVDAWRKLPSPGDWHVTPETVRLLQHWRHHPFSSIRPFFCQIEAVETAIWLSEVAAQVKEGHRILDYSEAASQQSNPGLVRLALKLATGAGKTTVMAMIIAWQTINAVRRPNSKKFTRGFLVVTPGLTIRGSRRCKSV
ncbi:MAG: DEAD/DEAH box helicase family protein [Planctomycetes bacterium]|nr:DEAD/DEAH box helicase family protein [Planctomycetota bacterium]